MKRLFTFTGIVIGRRDFGEFDCYLDLLTDEFGVIEVLAKGLRKNGSKYAGAANLFSYARFCLSKRDYRYSINSAEPVYSFHGVARDLSAFALAGYFSEIIKTSFPAEQPAGDNQNVVRFCAMTLYELTKQRLPLEVIKAIFETRIALITGHAPDVIGCLRCGKHEHEHMLFSCEEAGIFCGECANLLKLSGLLPLSSDAVNAFRQAIFSEEGRVYSSADASFDLNQFCIASEKYLLYWQERNFKTLDYYYKVK